MPLPCVSISARLRVDLSVRVFILMPIFVFSFAMALCPCAVPPQASMAVWASWFQFAVDVPFPQQFCLELHVVRHRHDHHIGGRHYARVIEHPLLVEHVEQPRQANGDAHAGQLRSV